MVLVQGRVCVDRFEAALQALIDDEWVAASPYATVDGRVVRAVPADGAVPQGYISGDEAEAACQQSGKRLCTTDEWLAACQGPDGWTFPYGPDHIAGACNDDYEGGHPVVDYFGTSDGVWDAVHMNDPGINQQPGTVTRGGELAGCESAWGVFDLHGNLHEWVADAEGTFRGGFYADASINGPGCTYRTTAHGRGYHDYSTGFRCCRDPG
jgi:formylglycine-generating enzyme required for sulfatase activity